MPGINGTPSKRGYGILISAGVLVAATATTVPAIADDALPAETTANGEANVFQLPPGVFGEDQPSVDVQGRPASDIPRLPRPLPRKTYAKAGLFDLVASGDAGLGFEDNVYRTKSDEKSDFFALFRPRLEVRSDLDRHALEFRAGGEFGKYFSEDRNDYADGYVEGLGRLDVGDLSSLTIKAAWQREHIRIGAGADELTTQDEPTVYQRSSAGAEGRTTLSQINLSAGADFVRLNYDNTSTVLGSPIIHDDRDRDELYANARVGYQLTSALEPYVLALGNRRWYDTHVDGTLNLSRNSNGYGGLGGLAYRSANGRIVVDGALGALRQTYTDTALSDVSALAAKLNLSWLVTPEFKLLGSLNRTIEETTRIGSSAYVRTDTQVGAEYAFAPSWRVHGGLGYARYDFETASGFADRDDNFYDGELGISYDINETWRVGAIVHHTTRTSSEDTAEYDDNTVLLKLTLAP